jgi:hypothetical protein
VVGPLFLRPDRVWGFYQRLENSKY